MRASLVLGAAILSAVVGVADVRAADRAERRAANGVEPETALGQALAAVVDVADAGGAIQGRQLALVKVKNTNETSGGGWVSTVELLDVQIRADPDFELESTPMLVYTGAGWVVGTGTRAVRVGELESGTVVFQGTGIRRVVRGALPPGALLALWVEEPIPGAPWDQALVVTGPGTSEIRGLDPPVLQPRLEVQSLPLVLQGLVFPDDPALRGRHWARLVRRMGPTLPESAPHVLERARGDLTSLLPDAAAILRVQVRRTGSEIDELYLARVLAALGEVEPASTLYEELSVELIAAIAVEAATAHWRAGRSAEAMRLLRTPIEKGDVLAINLCRKMRGELPELSAGLCPEPDQKARAREHRDPLAADGRDEELEAFEQEPVPGAGKTVVVEDSFISEITFKSRPGQFLGVYVTLAPTAKQSTLRVWVNPPGGGWMRSQFVLEPGETWSGSFGLNGKEGRGYVYVDRLGKDGGVLESYGSRSEAFMVEM